MIAIRKQYKVFGRGSCRFLTPENNKILVFIREYEDEKVLVITNLSCHTPYVALDLSLFQGLIPIELFSQKAFPTIEKTPFVLTPGPYAVYWFSLETMHKISEPKPSALMVISDIKRKNGEPVLEPILHNLLMRSRWFAGKGRVISEVRIVDRLASQQAKTAMLIVEVTYAEGKSERYFVPLIVKHGQWVDAFESSQFCKSLLKKIAGAPTKGGLTPKMLGTEQSNTSVVFGNRFILKVYRKLTEGENKEQQIGLYLTQKNKTSLSVKFPNTPKVLGAFNLRNEKNKIVPIAILHAFIPDTKNGWDFICENLNRSFERIATRNPPTVEAFFAPIQLLGQRTAELHRALSEESLNQDFAPEPYQTLYQQEMYQSLRNQAGRAFRDLRNALPTLPSDVLELAAKVLAQEQTCLDLFSALKTRPLFSHKIRIHGDYHLGQTLYTGKDFMIIDFEGEPSRPLSVRIRKRSSLYDVAGMLRSFHYAAAFTLMQQQHGKKKLFVEWAEGWYRAVSRVFLQAYVDTVGTALFLPTDLGEFKLLLNLSLIEKALYEIHYELNNRPEWLRIPLFGLHNILTHNDIG
jgi:maltose alpha-D-glucosyltransferase/alpha-amylase